MGRRNGRSAESSLVSLSDARRFGNIVEIGPNSGTGGIPLGVESADRRCELSELRICMSPKSRRWCKGARRWPKCGPGRCPTCQKRRRNRRRNRRPTGLVFPSSPSNRQVIEGVCRAVTEAVSAAVSAVLGVFDCSRAGSCRTAQRAS